ncbi:MAG: cobalamin-dependent protein [Actinobacteria bacterium]|nr:cobalamin-dependent protein [Actinomycetota bacterium]
MATTPLAQALGNLDEASVMESVRTKLDGGEAPLDILGELQAGMDIVGARFESGEYFLSELLYAADIFKLAGAPLAEGLKAAPRNNLGTIVLGTARHDIHDFGKDIVATIMRSNGIEVIDLGVDVEQQAFVDAIEQNSAQLVGISCLLTTAFDEMKQTVESIKDSGLRNRVTILVGGGPVDQACADYVGADVYCRTAQDGVSAAKKALGVS